MERRGAWAGRPAIDWRARPALDAACPFCPGNEAELPHILWELPAPDGRWRVRSVVNRYPAFQAAQAGRAGAQGIPADSSLEAAEARVSSSDPAAARPAVGRQEVIIETPVHGLDPSLMSDEDVGALVEGYWTRYRALAEPDPHAHVILFKNRGAAAGNSLVHPHAQVYALRGPVPEIDLRHTVALEWKAAHGRCALCALEGLEPAYPDRLLTENRSFRALVPWAASATGEVWIVPRDHQASFGQASELQRNDLAALLAWVLRRMARHGGDPAYNAIWHGGRISDAGSEHLHWHVQILPRSHVRAGFERGAGLDICPTDPLMDAARLRAGD